nr:response regulator [Rubellimicrobium sp. CFH 75288]
MLVEDEPSIVEAVSFILTRAGWTVHAHADGATALDRARAGAPELVVLDAMLPGRSGFDVLRDLRADPVTAAIPVLMLTARGQERDRDLALRLGATGFMTKPFANAELVAEVRRLAGG